MNKKIVVLSLALAALLAILALGVATAQGKEPTYGTAVVNGDYNEWDLTQDFFAHMYRAGNPDKLVESSLYLRYDCISKTLFALVLADTPTVTVQVDGAEEHWLKVNGNIVVDEQTGDDGLPPDFSWVGLQNGAAQGWEASAGVTAENHSIRAHTIVTDDGELQTSSTIPLSLNIDCGATDVDISSFTARWLNDVAEDKSPHWSAPFFGIGALVGLCVIARFLPTKRR